MQSPDFAQLSRIEERLLKARLEAVRSSISHAGEKGRELEFQVRRVLRELLPPEYGLTTGFVASLSQSDPSKYRPVLSSQLDIIIYDAIRHSPLIHLDVCDVLPLEAVYGYVEVKASLCSTSDEASEPAENSIEACIRRNAPLRTMKMRAYRVIRGGSPPITELIYAPWLSMRGYVVAFEISGTVAANPHALASRMAQFLKHEGNAHLHGVLVPEHGFFYTRPVDPKRAEDDDDFRVKYTTEHPLLAFKAKLLEGLATFQRPPESWVPAVDLYLSHEPQWHEQSPTSE
jgi:hypothetical protein